MQSTETPATPRAENPELRPDGLLASDLWIDGPDAADEIQRRLDAGSISADEASNLERFARDGYFVFPLDVEESLFDALDRDVDRLWTEQPPWVAYAYGSLLTRFSGADGEKRKPASRIADLHEFSTPALELYLHPQLHRYVEIILDEPALATQSLYFQWGSQQALHRDPIHVRMTPPWHLVAAWIALEDIQPGCGELRYVPGSHKLPYYEFEPGRYAFDHKKDGDAEVLAGQQWDVDRCAEKGLEAVPLRCEKGECLIWHHSLLHGGSYPTGSDLTRKSYVVHYTSRSGMSSTRNTYIDPYALPEAGEAEPPVRVYPSDRLHRMRGCVGFESPLAARLPEEMRELSTRATGRPEEMQALYARAARAERRIDELHHSLEASRTEMAHMKASKFWKLRDAWWKVRSKIRRG